MKLGQYSPGRPIRLPSPPGMPEQVHVLSEDEILAINAARAAERALLVRGEPGTGKTQLAKAAAIALERAFVSVTVDSRTDARDLLWHFDAVSRLAQAQVPDGDGPDRPRKQPRRRDLAVARFIQPRALWWAFDWQDALGQARRAGATQPPHVEGCDAQNGVVVLIDEIDKADAEVPNGLLEALGVGEFTPRGYNRPVKCVPVRCEGRLEGPLVIITTNDERSLPDAFVRRCLVLHLELPDNPDDLTAHLVRCGTAHFGTDVDPDILALAAGLLVRDRLRAREENWRPFPGQAEFLDLVRAVKTLAPGDKTKQETEIRRVAPFAFLKHADAFKAAKMNP